MNKLPVYQLRDMVVVCRSKKTIMLWSHWSTLRMLSSPSLNTQSSTGEKLKLRCCCCHSFYSAALFTGSGKALASFFFKFCGSSAGLCAPAGSLHRCRLELDWFDVTPFQVLFQEVLDSLARASLASFPDTSSP